MQVPEGWKIKKFESVFNIKSGLGFKYAEYVEEGIPLIKIDNVSHGYITWENKTFLPIDYSDKHADLVLEEGDILLALNRPITQGELKIARVEAKDSPSILYQRVGKIFPLGLNTNNKYYYYVFQKEIFRFVQKNSVGSDQPFISTTELKKIKLPFPPLAEQQKIAQILSTWDQAITTTEQLLANSQQQKKALMQQLLTGKKRLLDDNGQRFSEEWKDCFLSDLAQIIVSPVDKKTIEGEIPIALCNYTDVYYNNQITRNIAFMKATATNSEIARYTLRQGDVVITKDSETPGDIAVSALVSEDLKGVVCGYHLAIVRPNVNYLIGAFLNYLFSMQSTRYHFFMLATGATRFGLSVGAINRAHFRIPEIAEQQKIAAVLTAADKEITILEQKIEHLKQEKKALMQQLLTGKRRVKTN